MMELSRSFSFEASHVLPNHPGKCSNLHGHSWKLVIALDGEVNKYTGMIMDYADVKAKVQPLIDDLDHAHLGAWRTPKVIISAVGTKHVEWLSNEVQSNPTSENLIMAIGLELRKRNITFSRLQLQETENTCCYLEYEDMMKEIRKCSNA